MCYPQIIYLHETAKSPIFTGGISITTEGAENKPDEKPKPFTLVTTHYVKPGKMDEFSEEIRNLSGYSSGYPGYMGVNFFRPSDPADGDFRVVLRFRSEEDFNRWRDSDERKKWIEREKELTIAPPKRYAVNGLETWFTLPGNNIIKPPKRHRQFMVTWLAVWPILAILTPIENSLFEGIPYLVQKMIAVAILVFLLTYVVTPFMTKAFKWFLYPNGMKKMETDEW
ncbi:antibiotic biosynthesis monooxygenase [Methanolacinia petrolearia]|uniref:antibiotic biosynthesis monooxygenase n=1 Tax=Methanolacinia petrolearia TaxID=54120 RepID=UPI003BAA2EBF